MKSTKPIITAIVLLMCIGCVHNLQLRKGPTDQNQDLVAHFTDPFTEMEFVLVPGGSFMMGSPENEQGRSEDEGPRQTVHIDAFYLGKYEVTQAQWEAVMGEEPSHFKSGPDYPVENVSWNDVQKFLKRLNKKTERPYRLPTEAEWEYACRTGRQTRFCFGNDNNTLKQYGWFEVNADGETHPVGTLRPNRWKLYDMHGNVSELVADGRRGYIEREVRNPMGPTGSFRALHRGGSWLYPAYMCRSSKRISAKKDFRSHIIGFRLAVEREVVNP